MSPYDREDALADANGALVDEVERLRSELARVTADYEAVCGAWKEQTELCSRLRAALEEIGRRPGMPWGLKEFCEDALRLPSEAPCCTVDRPHRGETPPDGEHYWRPSLDEETP